MKPLTPAEMRELHAQASPEDWLDFPQAAHASMPALLDRIEELERVVREIIAHDSWRNIPIDTHNCHLAITACEELDDIARAALPPQGETAKPGSKEGA